MPRDILGIITYTTYEAAQLLGVTRRTLMNYLNSGKMVASKIGGRWAITDQQIKDFVTKRSVVDNKTGAEYL